MKLPVSEGVKPWSAREREISPSKSRAALHAGPRYVIYLTGFQGDDEVAEEPP